MADKPKAAKPAKPKAKTPKTEYIVAFDIDGGDPVRTFDTLDKAKKFVHDILTKGYEDDNNMADASDISNVRVYKGVQIGKPRLVVEFNE